MVITAQNRESAGPSLFEPKCAYILLRKGCCVVVAFLAIFAGQNLGGGIRKHDYILHLGGIKIGASQRAVPWG